MWGARMVSMSMLVRNGTTSACRFAAAVCLWLTLSAIPSFASAQTADEAPPPAWSWFGDLMLRGDRVTGIPRVDDSISRVQARGRFGALYDPIPQLEFGAAIKLAAS